MGRPISSKTTPFFVNAARVPTFWTKAVKTAEVGVPDRPIDKVEQRWFVGAYANVGGGYASDPLAQRPLKWLMDKAAVRGLVFRDQVTIDTAQVAPPVTDSYREFAHGFYRFVSRPFYRPVGPPPAKGTQETTSRINETIDGSVFERWRADSTYRPPNLMDWSKEKGADPAKLNGAVCATDPKAGVPEEAAAKSVVSQAFIAQWHPPATIAK